MIFLTPEQLQEVEYLINQSRAGVHHLFSAGEIKSAFLLRNASLDEEGLREIKELFFQFISQNNIEHKRTFFKSLTPIERSLIIRTYFNIVENELVESQTFLI